MRTNTPLGPGKTSGEHHFKTGGRLAIGGLPDREPASPVSCPLWANSGQTRYLCCSGEQKDSCHGYCSEQGDCTTLFLRNGGQEKRSVARGIMDGRLHCSPARSLCRHQGTGSL